MGIVLEGLAGRSAISDEERQYVLDLIPEGGLVLEIGTLDGVTVAWWAQRRPMAFFASVDLFEPAMGTGPGSMENWKKNRQGVSNMILLVGTSDDLDWLNLEKFDFAFIDGDHSYDGCLVDLHNCAKYTRTLLVHDYGRESHHLLAGVTKAVNDFCAIGFFKIVEVVGTVAKLERIVP